MALSFTDEQIREITGQILAAPTTIKLLQDNKASAIKLKQDYKDLDGNNTVYTDNYQNIIDLYHTELKDMTGDLRTTPVSADILPAGQLADGNVYFPSSPIWKSMPPKAIDYINGLPITSGSTPNETAQTATITQVINLLTSGFNDGSASNNTSGAMTISSVALANINGFDNGDRIWIAQGANYYFGTITSGGGGAGPGSLGLSPIFYSASLPGSGAAATNNKAGFSDVQLDSGSGGVLRTALDTEVAAWVTILNLEKNVLLANDATGSEHTQILAAITVVNNNLNTIALWQADPLRFGSGRGPITSLIGSRAAEMTTRSTEIITALGSVVQAGDGSYTGVGQYMNYFKSVDLRINKASGTLRNYYQQDLVIAALDQRVVSAQNQASRDAQTFIVKAMAVNGDGTPTVNLKDVAGLSNGMAVKICSNTKPVISATITGIQDLKVSVSATIPADYTVDDGARLIHQN